LTGWIDLENRSLTGEERSWQHVATTFRIVLRRSPSRGGRHKAANTKVASAIAETLLVIGSSRVRASRYWKAWLKSGGVCYRMPDRCSGDLVMRSGPFHCGIPRNELVNQERPFMALLRPKRLVSFGSHEPTFVHRSEGERMTDADIQELPATSFA
jgi:hypothetical protein